MKEPRWEPPPPPPPLPQKFWGLPEVLIVSAIVVLFISCVAYLTLEPDPPSAEGPCREMLIPGQAKVTVCPHVDHVAEPVAGEPPGIFCRCWAEGDPATAVER